MRVIATALTIVYLAVGSAIAAPVLYGEAHLSVNKFEQMNNGELRMVSHNSLIGIKGSEDLDRGVKFIYKIEFGYDTTEQNDDVASGAATDSSSSLSDRDQWLGFANRDWGVIRMGVISTSYKSSGAALDPLYNTAFEQRGFLGMQSALHTGNGVNGGRSTNTIRIDTPSYQGTKFIGSYSLGEQQENTVGFGIHYKQDALKLNFDYLDSQSKNAAALKLGAGYSVTSQFSFSFQYESADAVLFNREVDASYLTSDKGRIDRVYKADMSYIMDNSVWVFSYGAQNRYSKSYMLAWNHKFSSKTDIYAGYGSKDFDRSGIKSDAVFAFGLRHKF